MNNLPSRSKFFGRLSFKSVRLLLAACAMVAWISTSSTASFSNTASVPSSNFSTGTLSLGVNPTTTLFNVLGIKPGDLLYAPLTVTNTGSLPLNWNMSVTSSNADGKGLALNLGAEIRAVSGSTCDSAAFSSSATEIASAVSSLGSLTNDAPQTLAPGASQTLCFKVNLPLSVANLLQGATTSSAFTFVSQAA